jgi:hypothetical protein
MHLTIWPFGLHHKTVSLPVHATGDPVMLKGGIVKVGQHSSRRCYLQR